MTDTEAPKRRSGARTALVVLPLVVFAGLAGLFFVKLENGGGSSIVPSALIGSAVPEFDLPPLPELTADGTPVPGFTNADLVGKVTLVNFWGSWCAPCRAEHPVLTELAEDGRFAVVGVNYKDQPQNARRFLGQLGNPFSAIGLDPNGRIAIDWGVYGAPETFIVGADGTIRFKWVGPLTDQAVATYLMPEIEKALASA